MPTTPSPAEKTAFKKFSFIRVNNQYDNLGNY